MTLAHVLEKGRPAMEGSLPFPSKVGMTMVSFLFDSVETG